MLGIMVHHATEYIYVLHSYLYIYDKLLRYYLL